MESRGKDQPGLLVLKNMFRNKKLNVIENYMYELLNIMYVKIFGKPESSVASSIVPSTQPSETPWNVPSAVTIPSLSPSKIDERGA